VTARLLLGGVVDPPPWTSDLIQTLDSCTGMPGGRKWIQDGTTDSTYVFGGLASPNAEFSGTSYLRKKRNNNQPSFPPSTWGTSKNSGSYFSSADEIPQSSDRGPSFPPESRFESDFNPVPHVTRHSRLGQSIAYSSTTSLNMTFDDSAASRAHARSHSMDSLGYTNSPSPNPFASSAAYGLMSGLSDENGRGSSYIVPKPELIKPLEPHEGIARAIALYDFQAVQPDDLSFSKGDVITIVQKSNSSEDWYMDSPLLFSQPNYSM